MYKVEINRSVFDDLKEHFLLLSQEYLYEINKRKDLLAYAQKIYTYATRYEVWDNKSLIGLIAIYTNRGVLKPAYITNVSIIKAAQGKGIAKELLAYLIDDLRKNNFKRIELEVKSDNLIAIKLYSSFGFIKKPEITRDNSYISMIKNL